MDKILEGEIDRFHVPDLLTFLDMSRRTGVLVMERTEQEERWSVRRFVVVIAIVIVVFAIALAVLVALLKKPPQTRPVTLDAPPAKTAPKSP